MLTKMNEDLLGKVNGGGFLDDLPMSEEDRASLKELERKYWTAIDGKLKGLVSDADCCAIINELKERIDYLKREYAA